MTHYALNKLFYKDMPPIKDIECIKRSIEDFLTNHKSKFYMLLNNENRYYTIFSWRDENKKNELIVEITSITTELGPIKDIVQNDDTGALEFWIDYNGDTAMFVLFDYSKGVIEVE